MEHIEVKQVVKECKSKTDVLKKLNLHSNGRNNKKLNLIIEEYHIDISHFDRGASKRRKYEIIKKECPVCGDMFNVNNSGKDEKVTCSYACSNTHFRSGKNHANYRDISDYNDDELRTSTFSRKYREICFENHKHECVVCGEKKILDIHHYDNNRKNNLPNNLIPICPTHHGYVHSKFKDEIIDFVDKYKIEFDVNSGGD